MLVEYPTAFDVPISRLGMIQQQMCFDALTGLRTQRTSEPGVSMQRAKRDGRNCVRNVEVIEHSVPAVLPPGQTLDAVPVAVEAERAERSAA
jgi:hypothetical protein